MTKEHAVSLFTMAGFDVVTAIELPNGYITPRTIEDLDYCRARPWWLIVTKKFGIFRIGWRKKVISIEWHQADLRLPATLDELKAVIFGNRESIITIDMQYVHAYSYADALMYLTRLLNLQEELRVKALLEARDAFVKKVEVGDLFSHPEFHTTWKVTKIQGDSYILQLNMPGCDHFILPPMRQHLLEMWHYHGKEIKGAGKVLGVR